MAVGHEVEMMDYHTETIATGLDPARVFEIASSMMPELEWRRGESEAQGARTVSGRHPNGATVTFWFESDARDRVTAEISFRGARPDADGSDAWQRPLMDRLRRELFPAVQAVRPSGLAPGVRVVADLWSVLPPDGEDAVSVIRSDDDLIMRVEYIASDEQPTEARLLFRRATFHLEETIPGRTALDGLFSNAGLDGAQLADLGQTRFLSQWLDDPANAAKLSPSEANHYFVMFWEAGVAHHVVAASVEVSPGG